MKRPRRNLGSWLAILNCVAWVLLVLIARSSDSYASLIVPFMIVLSLPFAIFSFFQSGLPAEWEIVLGCTAIGLNSLVWGHGLAAILRRLFPSPKARDEQPS